MKLFRREYVIAILVSALIVLGLGLFVTDTTYAMLKATAVVYAWDEVALAYQNSNVVVTFNGGFVPFLHEIGFDTNLYPQDFPPPFPPGAPTDDACFYTTGVNTYTEYAGVMQYGVYHTDNSPAGAPGFVLTRNWKIVACDRDSDGDFDGDDLSYSPSGTGKEVTEFLPATKQVLIQDEVIPCSTGNCQDEIVTTFYINFDTDCDGDLSDEGIPPGGLCFYAEAQTPNTVTWGGPIQGRISAGGGDKTVSFSPRTGATAVTLSSFAPSASGAFSTVLLALGVGGMVLLFWRARRRT